MKTKTPTMHEKIIQYEDLLHRIQLLREVTMDGDAVRELLDNICRWSYAHRQGNGELSELQQQKLINGQFWKLTDRRI
jgi:hypothetical protein